MRTWTAAAGLCAPLLALRPVDAGTIRGVPGGGTIDGAVDIDAANFAGVTVDAKNVTVAGRRLTSCSAQLPCPSSSDPCCSQWGFCGHTDAYCGAGCLSGCPSPPTPPPTPPPPTDPPTPPPTSPPAPGPVDPYANQVLNPGFEEGLTYWQAKGPGSAQVDSAENHSGAYSVLCKDRTASWNGVQQHLVPWEDVLPNARYLITCWARLKNAASDNFKVTIKTEDDDGPKWRGVSTTINSGGWTLLEGYITTEVAGQMTSAKLSAEGPAPGVEFWVDDVSLVFQEFVTNPPTPGPTSLPTPLPTKYPTFSPTDPPTPAPTNPPTPPPTNLPTTSPTSSLAPTLPSSNLVHNHGFEDGALTPWYSNSGSATVIMDSTEVHSGTQSALCKDRTATWMGVEQEVSSGGRVVANAKYHVSCWVKLKNTASANFKITFRIEDDDGADWRGITRTVGDGWTFVEGFLSVVDVSGTLSGVYMYLNGPGAGVEYWVDDISLEFVEALTVPPSLSPTLRPTKSPTIFPTTSPTSSLAPTIPSNPPSNLLHNHEFEADTLTPWYSNSGSATVIVDDTEAHSGTQSALCKDRTAAWMGVEQEVTSGGRVVANAKYHVSCWVKLKNASNDDFKITFRIEDDDGTDWRGITRTIGGGWTFVEGFLSVVDVSGALSGVYMYLNGPGAGVEYWVDGVSLEFVEALTASPSLGPTLPPTNSPTKFPTAFPTHTPTTNPTKAPLASPPVTMDRMLYCGIPTKCNDLGGDEVVSNMNDLHAVRCCTEDASLNWPYKCQTIQGVFGESNVPDCYSDKSFSEAVDICSSAGGRLCTGDEMKDKCTEGTGCGANKKLIWGCTDVQGACTADAECCAGFCDQGLCADPSPSAPTNTPTIGPLCSAGYINSGGDVCCASSCGACGGSGCGGRPGGGANCCVGAILTANVPCTSSDQTACVLPPAPTPNPQNAPTKDPTPEPTPNPSTAKPTPAPTNYPTPPPTPSPTNQPTGKPMASSFYGNGPFVTLASSSEIVTIPRPPPSSLGPRTNCPHTESGLLSWHDATTWAPGNIPSAGQDVTLPSNSKVVIVQSVVEELGVITVPSSSSLIFDENAAAPITLDVAGMDVRGSLRAGSETCRYNSELVITLHGSRPNNFNIYGVSSTAVPTYKGISVNGGIISLHGKRKYPTWSRLAESVPAGQQYLLVQEPVNWEVGQDIILTTTAIHDSRNGMNQNEVLTISSVVNSPVAGVGAAIHFTTPTAYAHIANNGYQAEVGLLSRNIKIQGAADDSDPTDPDTGSCTGQWRFGTNYAPCPNKYKTGFGGHIMVHSAGGKGYVEGVELYRMGQTNVLGRYPFHFHILENECDDCYFKENSIHKSYYRCISIHGTHSTTVSENVAFDVTGYCYYLEDGVEENNILSFNLAAHIHPVSNIIANAGGGQTIPVFSQSKNLILPADVTASGFYLTNLHNDFIGNAASGGWAGFALPVLHSPVGPHKDVNMRPGNRLTKTFDGNTAHSTGWWWSHAGAFYSGGSLYYSSADPTLLEYNAGRDQSKGHRSPCLVDKCVEKNDCNEYCFEGERAWFQLTNSKIFLTASPGLNSWSGGMEISHFEAHDVALGLESLSATGFGIHDLLVECRSGEKWVMPGNPNGVTANGFFWYDTNQEHIITSAIFRNCGARKSSNFYDSSSPTRGCSTNSFNGCTSTSSVWGFITHSDQHTPELMQATNSITYEDCGTRFRLYDYADQNVISSVSARTQNWEDLDGSASGLNEPTIIASGLTDAGHWWRVEDGVVDDPEGPLIFIKKNDGPERSLGHIRLRFSDNLFNSVGKTSCMNGPKTDGAGNLLCPTIGRVRHIGPLFDSSNDPSGGLPITANAIIAGPTGGFGWLLNLDAGPPKSLRIDQIEVDPSTTLILAIPYPQGVSFSISAHAPWCTPISTHSCTEQFTAADSVAHVRNSPGNKYYYDNNTKLLYIRIIMFPLTYTGDNLNSPTAMWHLWGFDDPNNKPWDKRQHALDRYSFDGVLLPKYSTGNYIQVTANCDGPGDYCSNTPSHIEPQVCPAGYVQVSYDKCCASPSSANCYDFTAPPTRAPTSQPTFGSNSNLFYNPGFEDNTLTPWYANSGTIQIVTGQKHSGSQSVLCKGRTATWMGVEQDMLGEGRFVANSKYRVSCWAKLKNAGSASLKITLKTVDGTGTHYKGITATINNYSWTFVEGDLTVDAAGALTAADLYFNGPGSGVEFWVDDVSAVLVPW